MYRVCLTKDGKLIEMQSGGTTQEHLDTLSQNAINGGYSAEEIEVKFVNEQEWVIIQETLNQSTAERMARTSNAIRKIQIEKLLENTNTPEAEAIRLLIKGGF